MDAPPESTYLSSFTNATAESPPLTEPLVTDNAQTQALSEPATDASVAAKIQQLTDRALQFLSSASNETLGACVVGLGAATYFVLGRVGLVLIGVVGGVVLHATWENSAQDPKDGEARAVEIKRRKQIGLDVVSHVLEWRRISSERNKEEGEEGASNFKADNAAELDFADFQPSTAAAMKGLIDAVVRDYVKWWYGPLIPTDQSFPSSSRRTLTQFLLSFSSHLSRKRPADSFVDFLTNTSSIIIVFLNELSSALMRSESSNLDCSDALAQYIEENPDGHLASITDIEQQKRKLKAIAEDILHSFLDTKAYECEPARVFFREVLSDLILEMTIESCSKPEFINGWIVYLLEEADTELMDAIDAGVGGATATGAVRSPAKALDGGAVPKSESPSDARIPENETLPNHKRTVSRAEDAMEEAMQEAKRLTELIAAEEAKKDKEVSDTTSSSTTTTNGPTPTSSESDLAASARSFDENMAPYSSPATQTTSAPAFTTFDQILPQQQPTALQANRQTIDPVIAPLTLHNASVSIFDDEQPGEKATMRSKPTIDYLLQIEPATSQHPGWMIARKYADFETLHEVLRRISVVSGVAEFAERHAAIPTWKNRTKAALRKELEHYLRDALSFNRLAESEAMKRFLEKDQGLGRSSPSTSKGGFGFPSPAAFETMGKGMLDVLSSAPKGAASGGKAVVGGFTGVLGIGQKKSSNGNLNAGGSQSISRSRSSISPSDNHEPIMQASQARQSTDSLRNMDGLRPEPTSVPHLPERPVYIPQKMENGYVVPAEPAKDTPTSTPPKPSFEDISKPDIHLPPPPSEIPDDYNAFRDTSASTAEALTTAQSPHKSPQKLDPSPTQQSRVSHPPRRAPSPLTEPETCVAVELFFALITELYTLSSAWSIRLTLLSAAKTYLLRPGNPSLSSIRALIQDTIIAANTSDEGLAAHITKLRENTLPTEEEMKKWPKAMNAEEKEKLRVKARKLLTEKGVPTAVRGVVGQAATAEAMGRVFDSLQVDRVARGFVFAIVLQGVKAVAQ